MSDVPLNIEDKPVDDINKRLSGAAVNRLSSGARSRLFKGLDAELVIYPIERNTYDVISLKDNGENSHYTVSVFDRPICECMDYVMRCVGTDNWCKHIFRVWAEIRVGELPPLGVAPRDWLRARLEDELLRAIDTDQEAAKELRAAYRELEPEYPDREAFRRATLVWRKHRDNPP